MSCISWKKPRSTHFMQEAYEYGLYVGSLWVWTLCSLLRLKLTLCFTFCVDKGQNNNWLFFLNNKSAPAIVVELKILFRQRIWIFLGMFFTHKISLPRIMKSNIPTLKFSDNKKIKIKNPPTESVVLLIAVSIFLHSLFKPIPCTAQSRRNFFFLLFFFNIPCNVVLSLLSDRCPFAATEHLILPPLSDSFRFTNT